MYLRKHIALEEGEKKSASKLTKLTKGSTRKPYKQLFFASSCTFVACSVIINVKHSRNGKCGVIDLKINIKVLITGIQNNTRNPANLK